MDIKNWIETTLLEQDNFTFESLGPKRVIYSVSHHAPMACLFVDPLPDAPVTWSQIPGNSRMDSFFKLLLPIVERHSCHWFFVSMPQNEYTVLKGVGPCDATTWNPRKLYALENIGSEGGMQLLCLSFEKRALLVFKLNSGFEIAYYGPEDIWKMITMALYINPSRIYKWGINGVSPWKCAFFDCVIGWIA